MTLRRGDVVIADFPQSPGNPPKRRPALVVQSDHNNNRLTTTILVAITSNVRLAGIEPTQVLIDVTSAEGAASGLTRTSAVKCENVYTFLQSSVVRVIGRLEPALMNWVDGALRRSFSL